MRTVKRVLPGALEALAYYRAMFDPAIADLDLVKVRRATSRPVAY
jgi:hypothetical protein